MCQRINSKYKGEAKDLARLLTSLDFKQADFKSWTQALYENKRYYLKKWIDENNHKKGHYFVPVARLFPSEMDLLYNRHALIKGTCAFFDVVMWSEISERFEIWPVPACALRELK